ncbi:hypothetical protein IWX46DRAFT_672929 [Phyllosticta citricarpa]|uniref:Uncharacterized protein n=1 Tax=Phyllosticta citricarpa TaxID=55181 RepID=A0ABR1L367_9PEZI
MPSALQASTRPGDAHARPRCFHILNILGLSKPESGKQPRVTASALSSSSSSSSSSSPVACSQKVVGGASILVSAKDTDEAVVGQSASDQGLLVMVLAGGDGGARASSASMGSGGKRKTQAARTRGTVSGRQKRMDDRDSIYFIRLPACLPACLPAMWILFASNAWSRSVVVDDWAQAWTWSLAVQSQTPNFHDDAAVASECEGKAEVEAP